MFLLSFAGWLAFTAAAQSFSEPPLLVQLIRRAGPNVSVTPYANAGAEVHVFGLTAVTGSPETWLLETHNSFASIEDVTEALRQAGAAPREDVADFVSSEALGPARSIVAVYRPWLSYRPDQAIRMFAKARYFYVSLYRIRPGADGEFTDVLKNRREALDNMNLDRPDLLYQVVSGAAAGTYLVLAPLASLRTLDEGLARRRTAYYSEPSPAAASRGANRVTDAELVRSHLVFRVEPRLSWVSDDFAAEAMEFWKGKK